MTNFALILSFGIPLLVVLLFAIVVSRYRKQGSIVRSLNTSLYKVVLPKDGGEGEKDEKKEQHKTFKDRKSVV